MYLYVRYEDDLTLMNEQFFRDCSTDPFWDIINQWLRMANTLMVGTLKNVNGLPMAMMLL